MKPERSNTFCYYPFKSLAIKDYNKDKLESAWPCCMMGDVQKVDIMKMGDISHLTPQEIFDHPRFEQLRYNSLNNIRDVACETCWKQEDRGIKSFRLFSNDERYTDIQPNLCTVDITTSNVCNLRCRMCTAGSSNSLMIDYDFFDKHQLLKDVKESTNYFFQSSMPKNITNSDQWSWLMDNTHKIQILKASGGEPFYDKKVIKLLEKYIETDAAKNTTLSFHTNATVFSKDVLDIIKHFKHNKHVFSIDGTDKVYEYIRYPATFEQLNNSIKMYQETVDYETLSFNIVLSAHNIMNLPEFFKWVHKIDPRSIVFTAEVYPAGRGIGLKRVPIRLLQKVKQQLNPFTLPVFGFADAVNNTKNMIDSAIEKNQENRKLMLKETEVFDKSRNQRYNDYLNKDLVDYLSGENNG
jgi:organic radical activating enzyme